MALTPEQWQTVTRAVLRSEYPLLPDPLPEAVELLVPEWADRLAGMDPGVRSEQLGSYMVAYAQGGTAWLTDPELRLLRGYRRARARSAGILGSSEEAALERRSVVEVVL